MMIQYNNLLVLVAMEREFNEVLKCFPETHDIIVSKRLGIYAKEYNIKKYKFIITQSGVGTVNAALATALIAEQYPLDAILLLGVAGALQDFLKIGVSGLFKYFADFPSSTKSLPEKAITRPLVSAIGNIIRPRKRSKYFLRPLLSLARTRPAFSIISVLYPFYIP